MSGDDPSNPNLNRQLRLLGVCWVVYGILRLATTVWLVFFSNTATLMFGALLNRVPDPFTLMSFFHFLYSLLIIASAGCGILGLLAGLALLAGAQSGRMLAIIAAILCVSSVPLGTTLGIYTLVVLIPWNTRRKSATVPGTPITNLKRQPLST